MKTNTAYKQTEIGEIPEDWEVVRLGDIIREARSGFASGKRDENGVIQLRMNNISTDGKVLLDSYLKVPTPENIGDYLLRPGDILFNNTNSVDLIGKTALLKQNNGHLTYSNHITRIRVIEDRVIPEWVFYHLMRKRQLHYFELICVRHVGQSGIRTEDLLLIKIPLPPLPEQQNIASILSTLEDAIQKTDEIIQKTQLLKKGLMQQLLTKGIGHTKFKKIEIGEIPEEWEAVKLKDITVKIVKGIFDLGPENYVPNGVPFFRVSDIQDYGMDLSDTVYISESISKQFRNSELRAGDIVLAKVGASAGSVDKIAKIPDHITRANISQNLIGITVNKDKILPDYLLHLLKMKRSMESVLSKSNTTTFKSIRLDVLRNFIIALPEKNEQQKIASILSTVDDKIRAGRQQMNQLQQLKIGLMQVLLTGKVRVKVN